MAYITANTEIGRRIWKTYISNPESPIKKATFAAKLK